MTALRLVQLSATCVLTVLVACAAEDDLTADASSPAAGEEDRDDAGAVRHPDASDAGEAHDAAAPSSAAVICDPRGQDCGDEAKCAITAAIPGAFELACVDILGDVSEGEPCERNAEGFGHDDCAPGLFCSFIGELGPDQGGTRRCHAMCENDEQCGHG